MQQRGVPSSVVRQPGFAVCVVHRQGLISQLLRLHTTTQMYKQIISFRVEAKAQRNFNSFVTAFVNNDVVAHAGRVR